jgi:uncharacterized OsmC-like protein
MAISVDWASGDSFVIDVRAHFLTVDQPYADGGQDLGPTPTELFVASLAGCVGFSAERFLRRHDIVPDGLRVECDFEMGERPARVERIEIRLRLPAGFPESRRAALLAVVEHCAVHNSLAKPPAVEIEVTQASRAG